MTLKPIFALLKLQFAFAYSRFREGLKMKNRRNRIGLAIFNFVLVLALFMPGGISASSKQPTNQDVSASQDIKLAPDDVYSISGRVTDGSGNPIQGVAVTALADWELLFLPMVTSKTVDRCSLRR